MRVLLIFCLMTATLCAATITIPTDYPTIQQGIDAATNGDTILVSPGTYFENIYFSGKEISIKSTGGAGVTSIDGNGTGNVVSFTFFETNATVLDGFTITNGNANAGLGGGGIFCSSSSPTIRNNLIIGNSGVHGGGISCVYNSSPIITNNTISLNSATQGDGGGIFCKYLTTPIIKDNIISGNTAKTGKGGGLYCFSSSSNITYNSITDNLAVDGGGIYCILAYTPTIANNVISDNIATKGGGVFCGEFSTPIITNNIIAKNITNWGGGVYCDEKSNPFISNSMIIENLAEGNGGGIFCTASSPTITNCVITGNTVKYRGGGVYCTNSSNPEIINATFSKNSAGWGGGISTRAAASPEVSNTILWDNSAIYGPEISLEKITLPSSLTISYSDVKGGKSLINVESNCILNWGAGMINSDPLFVDSDFGDFHLTYTSPCKDTGDNSAISVLVDFEYDPRITNGTVDMGADEFFTHLYYTGDATPGGNLNLNFIDVPNTAPVVLWLGSGVLNTPINLPPHGDWFLQFPILLEAQLGAIPGPGGILSLLCNVPSTLPTPMDLPLQAGMGMKLTNLCVLELR